METGRRCIPLEWCFTGGMIISSTPEKVTSSSNSCSMPISSHAEDLAPELDVLVSCQYAPHATGLQRPAAGTPCGSPPSPKAHSVLRCQMPGQYNAC
jgi:hypothetical protein